MSEKRAVELTEARWSDHLTAIRRALWLMARHGCGKETPPGERQVVLRARQDLRRVADAIEEALG